MLKKTDVYQEPYRLFFPLGILFLLCGVLIWLPQIWNNDQYPVALHRFLVLNSFVGFFIAGFLMTAVPKFSQTMTARAFEVWIFLGVTLTGITLAHLEEEKITFMISALQALLILFFLISRIFKRKQNPPYTFIFIFVGLLMWLLSALGSAFIDFDMFKNLHYEGAIAAIILGVGSRLIPGIFGHIEIVQTQRNLYEQPKSILATVPKYFFAVLIMFIGSYFLKETTGTATRAIVVTFISMQFWKLYQLPKSKTALTISIWSSAWLIVLSFLLKAFWDEGNIHASHAFFINGLVLLSLLIATRVIQSHGPKDADLENWKGLYIITGIIFCASLTRITAYLLPESYLRHLGYSSLLLSVGILAWSIKYLRFVLIKK